MTHSVDHHPAFICARANKSLDPVGLLCRLSTPTLSTLLPRLSFPLTTCSRSICLGLFALLCWDALFAPAVPANPAADNSPVYRPFRSPFQSEPADLMTTAFAGRRRHILEGVYARVENGSAGKLIRRNWTPHFGKACTGGICSIFNLL